MSAESEKDIVGSATSKSSAYDDETSASSKSTKENRKNNGVIDNKSKSKWPMTGIKDPHTNDVLYGRGGGTNHHPGNKRYRKMVETRKVDYVNSKRLDKPLVALEIIKEWRSQDPPGRFLKMDDATGLWSDVGDKKAREKTSQALREKAPQLRKQQEEERQNIDGNYSPTKITSFDVPPSSERNLSRAALHRDHSLGRDFIQGNEPLPVDGFKWSPEEDDNDESPFPIPISSWRNNPNHTNNKTPLFNRGHSLGLNPLTSGSTSSPAKNPWVTNGFQPIVTPSPREGEHPRNPQWPESDRVFSHNEIHAEGVNQDFGVDNRPQRNVNLQNVNDYVNMNRQDYTKPLDVEQARTWQQSNESIIPEQNSFGQGGTRDFQNPGHYHHDASVPYDYGRGDEWRSPKSNHSSEHSPLRQTEQPPFKYQLQPPPPIHVNNSYPPNSEDRGYSRRAYETYPQYTYPTNMSQPTLSNESTPTRSPREKPVPAYDVESTNFRKPILSKPQPVKRETSNQNETSETKPQVKRINRQRSIGHRESSSSLGKVSETDMVTLGSTLEQSRLLDTGTNKKVDRPQVLTTSQRVRTIDCFDLDIETLDDDLEPNIEFPGRSTSDGTFDLGRLKSHGSANSSDGLKIPKPSIYSESDRISTLGSIGVDLEDIINS